MMPLRSRVWRDGEVIASDFPLADLDGHLADPSTLTWLDLCDPEGEVLGQLAEELQLDPTRGRGRHRPAGATQGDPARRPHVPDLLHRLDGGERGRPAPSSRSAGSRPSS